MVGKVLRMKRVNLKNPKFPTPQSPVFCRVLRLFFGRDLKIIRSLLLCALALVGCRDQLKETFAELDTDLRGEKKGIWKINIEAQNIRWRFFSYSPVGERKKVSGAYEIEWKNRFQKEITIDWGARFVDVYGLVIAELPNDTIDDVVLVAKGTHYLARPFTIVVDKVTTANEIRRMVLYVMVDGKKHNIRTDLRIMRGFR